MSIAEQLSKTAQNLVDARQAVLNKGGNVGASVAFDNLASEIESIPSGDANYVLVDDTDTAYRKSILEGALNYAKIKSIGGMTYKCNNLIPFPYCDGKDAGYTETINGITWTVNADGSITANGTATASSAFSLWGSLDFHLPKGIYTLSGANSYVSVYITAYNSNAYVTEAVAHNGVNRTFDWTDREYTTNGVILIVPAGATVTNAVVKPMLNIGTTALPFEKYYEGLRDTKVTAIKSHGANLAKMVNGSYDLNIYYSATFNNGHLRLDRKSYTSARECSATTFHPYTQVYLGAGTYTIKCNNITKDKISTLGMYVVKSNGDAIVNGKGIDGSNAFTLESPDTIKWGIYAYEKNDYADDGYLECDVMLNLGTTALPYSPYREPKIYIIPEAIQGSGRGVAGYYDTVDFERGKDIKRCETAILTGTEYTIYKPLPDTRPWLYYIGANTLNNPAVNAGLICNAFNASTSGWAEQTIGDIMITNHYLIFTWYPEKTADDFRAFLAERYANGNPVIVTYPIEPIETDRQKTIGTILEVEGGGYLEFLNEHRNAVPSHITYQRRLV